MFQKNSSTKKIENTVRKLKNTKVPEQVERIGLFGWGWEKPFDFFLRVVFPDQKELRGFMQKRMLAAKLDKSGRYRAKDHKLRQAKMAKKYR